MPKPSPRTRVVLIHNAKAGDEAHSTARLVRILARHGYRAEAVAANATWGRTDPLGGAEFIVVAGGDGTIRRIATRLAHRGRPLALLPLGTANNIATSLGITGEPDEVIASWKQATRRPMDLGIASGPWGDRRFIEGIGLGLIGHAITTLEGIDAVSTRQFESREDKLYRDLCVLLALAQDFDPLPIRVKQDGATRRGQFLLLEILNINRAGPGVTLAERANPSDGQLDLVSVTDDERDRLLRNLCNHLAALRRPAVLRSQRGRDFTLVLHEGCLRIDDDVVWTRERRPGRRRPRPATARITVDPGALEFIQPRRGGR